MRPFIVSLAALLLLSHTVQAAPFNDVSKFRKADAIAKTINKPCHASSGNAITWTDGAYSCESDHGNLLNDQSETTTDSSGSHGGTITVTCDNGTTTTSGASCYALTCPSPTGSGTMSNGQSRWFYDRTSPPGCGSCNSYRQRRTCTNGVVDGSASYNKGNCSNNCGTWTSQGIQRTSSCHNSGSCSSTSGTCSPVGSTCHVCGSPYYYGGNSGDVPKHRYRCQ